MQVWAGRQEGRQAGRSKSWNFVSAAELFEGRGPPSADTPTLPFCLASRYTLTDTAAKGKGRDVGAEDGPQRALFDASPRPSFRIWLYRWIKHMIK